VNIRPAVDWPAEGLESLGACPLCHSTKRRKLHEHLTDVTFFAAPGEWTLWRCLGCRSAYLDPRPNRETIGLAYGEYFTHSLIDPPGPETTMQRIRKNLANGYRNARYGTELTPAWKLGYLVAKLVPSLGKIVDVQFRYLPRASKSGARALDIGCGNGAWLSLAKWAGWEVSGVEPDPVALAQGRSHGLDVRPSLGDFEADTAGFDYITLSHVIEHVRNVAAGSCTCSIRLPHCAHVTSSCGRVGASSSTRRTSTLSDTICTAGTGAGLRCRGIWYSSIPKASRAA
jgi:hypothetical protein